MKEYRSYYDFENAKIEYRVFCEQGAHDIQLFALPWYLDAVCENPNDWRVIVYKEKGAIVATFPFLYKQSTAGYWEIRNPWQAKRLGIWMNYGNNDSFYKKELFENKVVKYVIDNLPYFDSFQMDFDNRFRNWRVFYDYGFSQQTLYSYVLRKNIDIVNYLSSIKKQSKRDITNLEEITKFEISENFEDYWSFFETTYSLRNKTISYSKEKAKVLLETAIAKNACKIFFVKTIDNSIIGATAIFNDNSRSYCMFLTYNPFFKPTPSVLLLYHSIIDTLEKGRDFDFEGSMNSGIAQFYAGFNAEMEQYFRITKFSNKILFRGALRQVVSYIKSLFFRN